MSEATIAINSKEYFNLKKFEDSISNRGIERQKRIEARRRVRILDRILLMATAIALITIVTLTSIFIYENIALVNKNIEIDRLRTELNTLLINNEKELESKHDNIKLENLKMKAYLDLNMITPTDKNVIYFEKSD